MKKEEKPMKILFAAPDRDLLECYKKLLEADIGQTVTAFDGTQVLTLLATEGFDILILDWKIPRVDHKTIIESANRKRIPVIVLTDERPGLRRQPEEPVPNGILSYPFTFSDIKKIILDTLDTCNIKERTGSVSEDE